MVDLSLIVPTYNRANYLTKALKTFASQSLDNHRYEIIIIDNNSTDQTRKIFDEAVKGNPGNHWKYFLETKQGLHHARNRGILEAQGDIVVFGDDDIEASSSWLEKIFDAFKDDETIGIVGGRIYPRWDAEPPAWILDYGTKKTHPVFAYLDYGNDALILDDAQYVYGCNFAIRRDLAIKTGGSFPDVFPRTLRHLFRDRRIRNDRECQKPRF